MKKPIARFATIAVLTLCVSAPWIAYAEDDEDEEKVPEKNIPAAVMTTVNATLPGSTFNSAVRDDEDGMKIFEVKMKTADGKLVEVMVTPDGSLTETEEQLKEAGLPPAVAKTLRAAFPKGDLKGIEKKMAPGYEVTSDVDGVKYEMKLDAMGTIMGFHAEKAEGDDDEKEAAVAEAAIPANIMTTAKAMVPGAAFEKAVAEDEDGGKSYEVTFKTTDGREVEVAVNGAGALTGTEEIIKADALPKRVAATLKHSFTGGTAGTIEKNMKVIYEVHKEVGEQKYDIIMNENGKMVSINTGGEDEEGGEENEKGEKAEKGEKGEKEQKGEKKDKD